MFAFFNKPQPVELASGHRVALRLKNDILPYLVTARHLRRRPIYWTYEIYGWVNDLLAAFAGVGIAFPISQLAADQSIDLGQAIASMPIWLQAATVASVVLYVVMKVYFSRTEAAKVSQMTKECIRNFRPFEGGIERSLAKPDPMPDLDVLVREITNERDKYLTQGLYPADWYAGRAPAHKIEGAVIAWTNELIAQYGSVWTKAPPSPGGGPGGTSTT